MSSVNAQTMPVLLPSCGAKGLLTFPDVAARGLVVFAHGSGSSRLSPRNAFVAKSLVRAGFVTMLFDLLTDDEAAVRANVFDIVLLADRLDQAADLARRAAGASNLPLGFFGASTGAAAALVAAADRDDVVAIVSRGGRPDLAAKALPHVSAATLLIVGGHDPEVLSLNQAAAVELRCEHRLEVVAGATHLFEEPGKLEVVVGLARSWFLKHLVPHASG
ncbi:MAG TPA: dienelactone hydrolase family protein [Rhodopila sp.]|nr:dienelactone hydrolase family protein [Rhodopila sp.]